MNRIRLKSSNSPSPQMPVEPTDPPTSSSTCPPPVINLSSSINLSAGHFGIFEKGPKFVPTPPKADFAEFQEDIRIWKNRLRWAIYFDSIRILKIKVHQNPL